jgi:hypothetical protein
MAQPDAQWPDECKAEVAKKLCDRSTPAQLDVVAAAGTAPGGPGPLTTMEVVKGCITETVWDQNAGHGVPAPDTLDAARALPFTQAFVAGLCDRKISTSEFEHLRSLSVQWNEAVDTAFAANATCAQGGAATYFRAMKREHVDSAALDKALTTAWASDIVEQLTVKEYEATLVKALDNRDTTMAALKVLRKDPLRDEKALSTGGATLARLYVRGVPTSFCVDDQDRVDVVQLILTLPANERAAALSVLREAKQDDVVGAARRALGDTKPEEFGNGTMYELRAGYAFVCKDDQVSARLLELAGCRPAAEGARVTCPTGGAATGRVTKSEGKEG